MVNSSLGIHVVLVYDHLWLKGHFKLYVLFSPLIDFCGSHTMVINYHLIKFIHYLFILYRQFCLFDNHFFCIYNFKYHNSPREAAKKNLSCLGSYFRTFGLQGQLTMANEFTFYIPCILHIRIL